MMSENPENEGFDPEQPADDGNPFGSTEDEITMAEDGVGIVSLRRGVRWRELRRLFRVVHIGAPRLAKMWRTSSLAGSGVGTQFAAARFGKMFAIVLFASMLE